ncbi:hypothetical protein [Persicobacter sp. CCB-QB2]|uniref:hypothetical protein n=1 Tax=Persicobacter sp. CCB-QB2 TaxID=1561025 RepID=UPI0006A9A559|nr:hypothetical protein [Persicobacter sp. CCB-QB2]
MIQLLLDPYDKESILPEDEELLMKSTIGNQRDVIGANCLFFDGTYGLLFPFTPTLARAWVKLEGDGEVWQEDFDLMPFFVDAEFGETFRGYVKKIVATDGTNDFSSPGEQGGGFFLFHEESIEIYAEIRGFVGASRITLLDDSGDPLDDFLIYSQQSDCPWTSGDLLGFNKSDVMSITPEGADPAYPDVWTAWKYASNSPDLFFYSAFNTSGIQTHVDYRSPTSDDSIRVRLSLRVDGDQRADPSGSNPGPPRPDFDIDSYIEADMGGVLPYLQQNSDGRPYIGMQAPRALPGAINSNQLAFAITDPEKVIDIEFKLVDLGDPSTYVDLITQTSNMMSGMNLQRTSGGGTIGMRDFLARNDFRDVWNTRNKVILIEGQTELINSRFAAVNISNSLVYPELSVIHFFMLQIQEYIDGNANELDQITTEIFNSIDDLDSIWAPTEEDLKQNFINMFNEWNDFIVLVSREQRDARHWIQYVTDYYSANYVLNDYENPDMANGWSFGSPVGGRFAYSNRVTNVGHNIIHLQGFVNSLRNYYEGFIFPPITIEVSMTPGNCALELYRFGFEGNNNIPANPAKPGFSADGMTLNYRGQAAINAKRLPNGNIDPNPESSPIANHFPNELIPGVGIPGLYYMENESKNYVGLSATATAREDEVARAWTNYGNHLLSVEAHPDDILIFSGYDRANGYDLGEFNPEIIYPGFKVTSFGAIQNEVFLQVEGDHTDIEQVSLWIEGFGQTPFYDVELVMDGTQTRWVYPSSSMANHFRSFVGSNMQIKSYW